MEILKQINFILEKSHKWLLVGMTILIIVGSFAEMLSISAIMPVVYLIMDENATNSNEYLHKLYVLLGVQSVKEYIYILLLAIALLYIAKMVLLLIRNYYKYNIVWKIQKDIAHRMMKCYLMQPYSFHLDNNSASVQRKIVNDVGSSLASLQAIIDMAVGVVNGIFLLGVLLYADIGSTLLIGFILILFGLGFLRPFSKKLKKYGTISRTRGEEMIVWINQSLGGIKEVKVRENENYFERKFDNAYEVSANAEKMNQFLPGIPPLITETAIFLIIILVVYIKLSTNVDTTKIVAILATLALAGVKLLGAFSTMVSSFGRIYYTKPALDALYNDLLSVQELEEKMRRKDDNVIGISFQDKIDIRDLSFSYSGSEKIVLNHINFEIKKGESVAFIGTSGAGKTTLVDVILGLLEPTSGEISVDGMPIKDNMYEWHKKIGYIPQNIFLLDDTIRNNIVFGVEEQDIDEKLLWEVIEDAQLKDYVESLEEGLETIVGERGARISGGQMQRISIARALYTKPEILILDEATSALDGETESAVMEAIENLHGKLTLIIIAHRLTTIQKCDKVYKVEDGQIMDAKDSIYCNQTN